MTPESVVAFSPGHISGYFKRIDGKSPAETGSIGAGIVISEGVRARVAPAYSPSVCIKKMDLSGMMHEAASDSPPLIYVMKRLGVSASVVTECRLPIGAGFGLSAAALLATLTALNRLFNLGMSEKEVALHAHETEVLHDTGLGDVAASQGGGLVIRRGAGIDALVERRYNLDEPLFAVSCGAIHTPEVLSSQVQMEKVAAAFPRTSPTNIEEFFWLSREFADRSGLLTPEIKKMLAHCDDKGIFASMTMLGNGIFAYSRRAKEALLPFGDVYELQMALTGPRIIEGAE